MRRDRGGRHPAGGRQVGAAHWLLGAMVSTSLGSAQPAAALELNWYGPPGPLMADVGQQIAQDYQAVRPDVQVKMTGIGQSTEAKPDALITQIVGGVVPDIVFVQFSDISWWAAQGFLQSLDPLLGPAGFRAEEFIPGAWQAMQYQGRTYALPLVIEPFGLVWGHEALLQVGLDPTSAPATWSDLVQMAKKIFRQEGDTVTRYGAQFIVGGENIVSSTALTLGAQLGLPVADERDVYLDKPGWQTVFNQMVDMEMQQGGPAAWDAFARSLGSQRFGAFVGGWAKGNLGFTHIGPWVIGQVNTLNRETRLGVGPLPVLPEGRPVVTAKGWALAIPKGAPHPREALQFLRYLMSRGPMEKWYRHQSSLPAQLDVLRYLYQRVLRELPSPNERLAFAELAQRVTVATPARSPIAQRVIKLLNQAAGRVRGYKENPSQVLSDVARQLRSELADLTRAR